MAQVVPLQPMEGCIRADIHSAACGGPHVAASGCALKEAAAHGKLTELQAPGRKWRRPMLEQSIPEELHPEEWSLAGMLLEEQQPM